MGVRMLNRFLREKASTCIQLLPLSAYSGKRIVVDASIYMYRYIGDNSLIENFYLLCLLFRNHNISALFVFDGQPPKEKTNELKERASMKKKAKKELTELEVQLNNYANKQEQKELLTMKKELMKQCIHLKAWHLNDVKNLIDATGHQWITAPGEADHLCAKLVRDGLADACMSEDMDMFVHGCPRVLRYMSLNKENFVEYNLSAILETLKLSFQEFQELCILAGTDYSKWMNELNELNQTESSQPNELLENKTIFQYYQDIQSYQQLRSLQSHSCLIQRTDVLDFEPRIESEELEESLSQTSFFAWCLDTGLIDSEKYTQLEHIQSFFESENYPELNEQTYQPVIEKKTMEQEKVRKVLRYHHFY